MASDDPMIQYALRIDADARALRIMHREVSSTDTLELDLAPIGGTVAVFEPAASR